MYEAIGLLELESIACGIDVADAMVKVAPIQFIDTFMVTPGKYVVLVHGDVAAIEASVERGREVAAGTLVDWLLIPFIHPQVFPAIYDPPAHQAIAALGLIETHSVATGVAAADDAAKAAEVQLLRLHLGRGIGGKSMLTLTGELPDVQAAVEAGSRKAQGAGRLVAARVIPQPHPDLAARLLSPVGSGPGPGPGRPAPGAGAGAGENMPESERRPGAASEFDAGRSPDARGEA